MATLVSGQQPIGVGSTIDGDRRTLQPAKVALCLGLLVFLTFVSTLANDFVALDDPHNFLGNIGFRGFGWRNIQWAWTTTLAGVYQPIGWMLLEVQYLFTGLDPYGYHLASTLMHALNAAMLFYLTLELVRRCRPDLEPAHRPRFLLMSALSVALFAVHPMRTEVVAWASAQSYLPCALFAMLSVLAYLKANPAGAEEVRSRWLFASFSFYVAAMLSKASAIPLPAVFLVLDVYPLGRLGGDRGWWNARARPALFEKLPFFILCWMFLVVAVLARAHDGNRTPIGSTGIAGRITLSCYSVMFYPAKSLWPFDLHPYYMRPSWSQMFEPRFLLAVVGTVAATSLILRERKRHPGMFAAWMAYLIMLAPASGVITTGMQGTADRYGYLTMMAFVAPMAVGFCDLAARLARFRRASRVQVVGAIVMIAPLVVMTYFQCRIWSWSDDCQGRLDPGQKQIDSGGRVPPDRRREPVSPS